MKTIGFIVPYFGYGNGHLHPMTQLWFDSCGKNNTVDWFFFTDCDLSSFDVPDNVFITKTTFEEVRDRIQKLFDFKILLNTPYKLCDFKPTYGEAFKDFIGLYDFWGFCDIDLIFGNIRKFITDDILENNDRILTRGHCSIFRNTPENNVRYRTLDRNGCLDWKEVFSSDKSFAYDEWAGQSGGGYSEILKRNGVSIYNGKIFADLQINRYQLHTTFESESDDKPRYSIFQYRDGTVVQYSVMNSNSLSIQEYMYIHFQQRKLDLNTDLNRQNYFIIPPNKALTMEEFHPDLESLKKVTRGNILNWNLKGQIKRVLYNIYIKIRGKKMKKLYTCFSPHIVNNPYALNVQRLINESGFEIVSIKKVFTNPYLFFECKIFNFNWYENINSKKEYYLHSCAIDILRVAGKKIVYTIHNKKPHDSSNVWAIKLMRKMCQVADSIVGLCPDTLEVIKSISPGCENKLVVIPHPNYIYNYSADECEDLRSTFGFSEDDLVLLFLGFISPYKNLELIIELIKSNELSNTKLLIAGKPCSDKYREDLTKLIGNTDKIKCDFRYIPDEEIVSYYRTCNVVILPYQKNSSLNSGAVYLSFSLKKTVICPDIGTINALSDKSFVYWYHYESDEEHTEQLRNKIIEVCDDYAENPQIVEQKGLRAFDYMNTIHNDEIIKGKYAKLYRSLLANDSSGD